MLLTRIRPALRDLYVINENKARSKRPMLLTRIRPALRVILRAGLILINNIDLLERAVFSLIT